MIVAPKFGTSGLRGLVTELTPDLVADYIRAFLAACPTGGAVHVGHDLRASSPDIACAALEAVAGQGLTAIDCGALPTPALALGAMDAGHAAIMITGSHIPADRNGIKFYVPHGEISKADEAAIRAHLGRASAGGSGVREVNQTSIPAYVSRYVDAFGPEALAGLRIGIYEQSSVARDILHEMLVALGATPVPLGRSETFIPIDTEAVDPKVAAQIAVWSAEHGLDAVISTDADADRPLVADETGQIVPGDVLGPLTSRALGAEIVVTPVSSNSLVDQMGEFARVARTKIGSPYVIAEMEAAMARDTAAKVVGYEANGGFLLGFNAQGPAGPLAPLATRDSFLPILSPLATARAQGLSLSALVAELPPIFTAADRLQEVSTEASKALIDRLTQDAQARAAFFEGFGEEDAIDVTDGLRVSFTNGRTVHLRPSGNAPECRCYGEAGSREAAQDLVTRGLERLRKSL